MKLDKFWKFEKEMVCPLCGHKGLWYDTHSEKNATHFCKNCDDGLLICGNMPLRGDSQSESFSKEDDW